MHELCIARGGAKRSTCGVAVSALAVRRLYCSGSTAAVRWQYGGSTAAVRRRQYAGSHRSSSKAVVVDVIVVKMHNDHGEPQPGRCLSNYSGRPNVYESWLELNLEILEFYSEWFTFVRNDFTDTRLIEVGYISGQLYLIKIINNENDLVVYEICFYFCFCQQPYQIGQKSLP